MNVGDRFKAVARLGETFYTRFDYEGTFTVLRIEDGVYTCGLVGRAVRRVSDGKPYGMTAVTARFGVDPQGLLRELKTTHGFKGSAGFREVK